VISLRALAGQHFAVLGLARSGLAAARALIAGGAEVVAWDDNLAAVKAAEAQGLPVSDLHKADWSAFDGLVLSPGVPLTYPEPHWTVAQAHAWGVPVLGDVELFARAINARPEHDRPKICAITGTNGKSTTTALIGHLCAEAGRSVQVGGNIGYGVLGLEEMGGDGVYVLELSSYQLDLTSSLKADAAILLNISPDHLDRHGSMDNYAEAKKRVFRNQGPGDTAVIGVDDPWGQRICTEVTALNRRAIRPISAGRAMSRGVYALQGVLYDATGERAVEVANLSDAPALLGRHNWQNAAAAYAAGLALGLSPADIVSGLRRFGGLAHRMQQVAKAGEVRFVNDSKATNADAARQAMATFDRFYWIAGGRAKAGGIESLIDLYPRIVKAYLIGEAQHDFAMSLAGRAEYVCCEDLATAVSRAYADAAQTGASAVVLLSPACASFDQFPDFEARGEAFTTLAREITGRCADEAPPKAERA
jgi:UDP-N-acetylmuramoylalanine--D-glutamate ligase